MEQIKRKKHILLVDDEVIHRMGIRDRLEAFGYKIDSVEGGEEALRLLLEKQKDFDLIILDLLTNFLY